MQRRQPVERRGAEAGEQVLDGGQDPLVRRARPSRPVPPVTDRAPCGQRGQRAPADEGVAAPALAALDRLEEEAVAVADQVGEGGHRGQGVGHHLAPHRDDGVLLGQGGELDRIGPEGQHRRARGTGQSGRGTPGPWPIVRKKQRPLAGVAGALARAGRPGPRARRRRSPCAPRARTGGPPRSRPSASTPGGCGCRTTTGRLEGAPQRLGVHVGHGQHGAVGGVLDDRRHQAVLALGEVDLP